MNQIDKISTDTTASGSPKLLSRLPLRLHHRAIVVRDQEATRHFMEDIIGMPLVATWCESIFMPEVGRDVSFCHTFFALEDESCIAFFQFADQEIQEKCYRKNFPEIPRFDHIAIKATRATQNELVERLKAASVPYRETNHGYCKSIYVTLPDGLYLEFADDPPDIEEIGKIRRADAHKELARWLEGQRGSNNAYRLRDF
ncbi:VOC family protein [Bradyrhizobium canariense]|uniref:Catechol 2,3-dioxygenase n=1 Tax=Bradyrhizobium canariense TaxID=255045 RepID=A0A1H1SHX3_9BRAD|nr:VOC family protein [Bradyrhizobium canariense]SDS47473.1 Catechol 2,3-dioxygenase [Bradyrhizobium canariense]